MDEEAIKGRVEEWESRLRAEAEQVKSLLESEEFLDEDGYPTETSLKIIELWPYQDAKGWFKFIESIWHLRSWGWSEGEADHDWKDGRVYLYEISTAGWSGNEIIISAMKNNWMLWNDTWVQSRRGGHYIFERELDDE